MSPEPSPTIVYDAIFVGAGISGFGMAMAFKAAFPTKTFVILEARGEIGGTWSFFKYPGLRSDSEMTTLGFSKYPFHSTRIISEADAITEYLRHVGEQENLGPHFVFNTKVKKANYNVEKGLWTLSTVRTDGTMALDGEQHPPSSDTTPCTNTAPPAQESSAFVGKFYVNCSGYYDYNSPHTPSFTGQELFKGQIVHPQFWPTKKKSLCESNGGADDAISSSSGGGCAYSKAFSIPQPAPTTSAIDVRGKSVAIIGSGATALSLAPALVADGATVVHLLQRSPSYIYTIPRESRYGWVRRWFGEKIWWRWTRFLDGFDVSYWFCRTCPSLMRQFMVRTMYAAATKRCTAVASPNSPNSIDGCSAASAVNLNRPSPVSREAARIHFTPWYKPWEQRFLADANEEFMAKVRSGEVVMHTGIIERFNEEGVVFRDATAPVVAASSPSSSAGSGAASFPVSSEPSLIKADVIVTATGLRMLFAANIPTTITGDISDAIGTEAGRGGQVDCHAEAEKAEEERDRSISEEAPTTHPFDFTKAFMYKTCMLTGLPNSIFVMGYLHTSWTLKVEMLAEWFVMLMRELDARGSGGEGEGGGRRAVFTPLQPPADEPRGDLEFNSAYLIRALPHLPRWGTRAPYRFIQNVGYDRRMLSTVVGDADLEQTARFSFVAADGQKQ